MSEDVGTPASTGQVGESSSTRGHRRRKSFDLARARARFFGALTTVARWAGTLAAVLLTLHVVLTVGGANPANAITQFVANWAEPLALGFENLFPKPEAPKLDVLVNYGIAAVFWLIVTSLVTRVLRALG